MYAKLRHFVLSEDIQRQEPDWPYVLLFHGHEISRDIFFLDPLIECRTLNLGRNPVRDVDYLRYQSLNRWFHYRFFFCMHPYGRSGESATLKPRLIRLKRCLLESEWTQCLEAPLSRDFDVEETAALISRLRGEIERMIEICDHHDRLV